MEPEAMIYPPVDLNRFYPSENYQDYFLMVSRIAKEKRFDLVLDVFQELLEEKLVIVGGRPDYYAEWESGIIDRMESMKNVDYRGRVSDEELADLYAQAKGSINFGIQEDFGLSAPESFCANTPHIAPREGGFRETIVSGVNGVLVDSPYRENLKKTIKNWNRENFEDDLTQYARKYSAERFRQEWRDLIGAEA